MAATKALMKATCVGIMVSGLLPVFFQEAVAQTIFAAQEEQALSEQATSQTPVTCSQDTKRCCSAGKGVGGFINGFFAFGCSANYRMTNWVLSDKCDTESVSRGCPHASACSNAR